MTFAASPSPLSGAPGMPPTPPAPPALPQAAGARLLAMASSAAVAVREAAGGERGRSHSEQLGPSLPAPAPFEAAGLCSLPRRLHTPEESQMGTRLEPGARAVPADCSLPAALITIAARETRVYLCFDPPRPTAHALELFSVGETVKRDGGVQLQTEPFHCSHQVSWGIYLRSSPRTRCTLCKASLWDPVQPMEAESAAPPLRPSPSAASRHGPAVEAFTQMHPCTGSRLTRRKRKDSPWVISLGLFGFICFLFFCLLCLGLVLLL